MKKVFLMIALMLILGFGLTACSGNDNNTQTEQLAKDEIYTCKMHNEVMSDHPGECSKCGMKLVKQKMTPVQQKMMKEGTYVKPKE